MKSEKEKMLEGKPYKAFGEELFKERQYAKELIFDFNALRPAEVSKRNEIIRKLFGKTANNFYVEPPLMTVLPPIHTLSPIVIGKAYSYS